MANPSPSTRLFERTSPSLAVKGSSDCFAVGRVFCIARNYADHAREMGHDPEREPPFYFTKHADSVVGEGSVLPYPPMTANFQHEVELVVAIGADGAHVATDKALQHVFGYAVGLDMTRRDLQTEAKRMGRPWEIGKAFPHAAPCSAIVPVSQAGHPARGAIWLRVNGLLRQQGDLSDQIWSVAELIAHLSSFDQLRAGDLIFTGTPAGVAAVEVGDTLHAGIEGIAELRVSIGPPG